MPSRVSILQAFGVAFCALIQPTQSKPPCGLRSCVTRDFGPAHNILQLWTILAECIAREPTNYVREEVLKGKKINFHIPNSGVAYMATVRPFKGGSSGPGP